MRLTRTADLWWKNAVVYCLDVETFADGNGDGCGDFRGLIQHIDHLDRLGVTCLWLMPFYPTPDRDDGYDITDFYGVDPRLGTPGDVVELVRTARDRGMRVIADLVVNHTSDAAPVVRRGPQQPRLAEARLVRLAGRGAAGRRQQGVVFPDQETSLWEYDEQDEAVLPAPVLQAPARPQRRQPGGPRRDRPDHGLLDGAGAVRVPGGRGAVPARDHAASRTRSRLPDPHDYLADLAAFLRRRNGEAVLLGEVNLPYPDTDAVLRRPRRRRQHRRADHVLRLHRHAAAVPVAGPRPTPSRWPRRCASGPTRPRTGTGPRSCATTTS